ncbi:MAG: hypothetical protein H6977_02110 [Gammaproteobacteria bacterium]|nr:hypothetical protein [Gammaproteobacteria bacterium]
MATPRPGWQPPGRVERLVGAVALAAAAVALVGLVAIGVWGPVRLPLAIFATGWALLGGATVAGLCVARALAGLRLPLQTCALGFLLVGLAFVLEAGAGPPSPLRLAGTSVLAGGLLWGLWVLGGLRR